MQVRLIKMRRGGRGRSHDAPELLLKLANEAGLNLVVGLELLEWHVDDHGLAPTLQIHLDGLGNVQAVQVSLQVAASLEINEGLCHSCLKVVAGSPPCLLNLQVDRHGCYPSPYLTAHKISVNEMPCGERFSLAEDVWV